MKTLRRIYRLIALLLFVLLGVVLTMLVSPPGKSGPPGALHTRLRQWWMKLATRIIGLRLRVAGKEHSGAALWVANHVSWLDIPVIGGSGNIEFLSKAEIRQWPVIGWLAEKSGTLFIHRGGKNASQNAAGKISQRILGGRNVLVFPEATTTDGCDVRRFHARLFAPVIDHKLDVQPISIRYLDHQNRRHSKAPFIDNERFLPNLMTILGEPSITVEVTFLPVLPSTGFSARKPLADQAHAQIRFIVAPGMEPKR